MTAPTPQDWLHGDGEMARRIRRHDWSATPLGRLDRWPRSLRNALALVLDHPFPMVLAWGPELTTLYNDAYQPLLGEKPEALGRPFLEVWSEARHVMAPQVAQALAGEAPRFENARFMLLRNGGLQEAYFDYSCSPVRDDTGAVAGVLNTAIETTGRMSARKEQAEAHAALRQSEKRYRTLFDAIDDGFCTFEMIFDAEGEPVDFRYIEVNDGFARQTGRLPRAGQTMQEVFPEAEHMWLHLYAEVVRSGKAQRFVDYVGGLDRWYSVYVFPLDDPGKNLLGALFTDVTDSRRAEKVLRESQEQQAFLLKLSDALRPIADPVAVQETASRMTAEQLDIGRVAYCEIRYEPDMTVIVERDWPRRGMPSVAAGRYRLDDFGTFLAQELVAGRPAVVADAGNDPRIPQGQRDSWSRLQITASCALPVMKEGQLVAYLAAQDNRRHDWTEREIALLAEVSERIWANVERARTEAALRDSEEKYRSLFESMDQAYAVVEVLRNDRGEWADFRFLEVNPAFMDHMSMPCPEGRTATELLGTHNTRWARMYGEVLDSGKPLRLEETEWTPGRIFDLTIFSLDKDRNRIAALFTDITERKRAEEALRESERLRSAMLDVLPLGLGLADREGKVLLSNRVWARFIPTRRVPSRDRERGGRWRAWDSNGKLVDPADYPAARALRGERVDPPMEFLYTDDDGRELWTSVAAIPLRDAHDEVVGAVAIIQNIDAAKRAADALRISEERLRQFGEASQDVLWMRDAETLQWTYLTPAFERIYGLARGEALAGDSYRNWLELVLPEDRAVSTGNIDLARAGEHVTFEYRIRRPSDGEVRWLRDTDFPIRNDEGRVVMIAGIGEDITERREWEERQKVLVAELQHRTRNLLGVVRSMADKTVRTSADLPDFRSRFRDRLDALARVQGLLSRLKEHDRVTFDELIRTELSALGSVADRVTLDGPDGVRLRSSAVQTLALALHELATNAIKYGALGQPSGHLAIGWGLEKHDGDDQSWLHIDWRESGVAMPPPGSAIEGRGQGRELIEQALPYQLGALTTYTLGPDGVHCTIDVPVSTSKAPAAEHA